MSQTQLSQVFLEHEEDLFRFLLRRIKCVFTARDMTHDLFLKISAQGETAHIQNQKAYLFRMAANLATDYLRVEQNRAHILAETNELLWGDTDGRDPERISIAREELARSERVLAQLPLLSRKIFHLNRFEGKSYPEIANELNLSPSTVEHHIRTALRQLSKVRNL
ncbi:ECF subfamily RNA polymerase sigma-24 factor [Nitrospira japonica]|uniref:ECF subfamily RNA polymerase sigma-24 factor n=1 Tax=Nitrospira japonica TaxID=1325564 RepID=A0A1W1I771_9BACT|nr:sigma-70 family RNA polymerase sigma factor [Nitrospira japonica]SLM48872.1 ECF subfamily RNA polymerase sigma-24 factor [Nitrospira japonica]